jgi:succinylglutamate desuccinylase
MKYQECIGIINNVSIIGGTHGNETVGIKACEYFKDL